MSQVENEIYLIFTLRAGDVSRRTIGQGNPSTVNNSALINQRLRNEKVYHLKLQIKL